MIRMFRLFVPLRILILPVVDVLLILGCFLAATWLLVDVDPAFYLFYENGLARILLVVAAMMLVMYLQDLYQEFHVHSKMALVNTLCTVMGATLLIEGLITYFSRDLRAPSRVMLLGDLLVLVAMLVWRVTYNSVIAKLPPRRVLFVGNSPLFEEVSDYLRRRPAFGMKVEGYVDDNDLYESRAGRKVIGPISDLEEIARAVKPDLIVVGMKERRVCMPVKALLNLRFAGFLVEEVPRFFEKVCGRISSKDLRPAQFVFSSEMRPGNSWIRAFSNFSVAVFGLVCALPVMAVIAIAVRMTSPGPSLYRQTRVGRNGRHFTIYKFRSMYIDAEKRTGAVWSAVDDPRITRIGGFLRRFRLDELPQLFNVLRGDMAIVGPRPERPEFVKVLSERIPYYRHRHCIRPGITGWAQINYKYGDSFEDAVRKLEYDLYYIKYMSQSLDHYIIFATIKTMLLTRGGR